MIERKRGRKEERKKGREEERKRGKEILTEKATLFIKIVIV